MCGSARRALLLTIAVARATVKARSAERVLRASRFAHHVAQRPVAGRASGVPRRSRYWSSDSPAWQESTLQYPGSSPSTRACPGIVYIATTM